MWSQVLASCVAAGVTMNPTGLADADTKPVQFEVQLQRAMPNDTPLVLYLDWRGGPCVGFALAKSYNKASHDLDASGLAYNPSEQTLKVVVKVTVNPDDYVPADRKPASCQHGLDLKVRDRDVTGTYDGTHGTMSRKGTVAVIVKGKGRKEAHFSYKMDAVLGGDSVIGF